MYLIYNLLLNAMGIILSPIAAVAFLIKPKLRAGFWQKIGFYKKSSSTSQCIWFHAVSVGEVNAIEGLVKKLKKFCPAERIVISTVTATGQAVAKMKLGNIADEIRYFPYEFCFSIKSAVSAINPKAVIVAETEIWPNFSHILKKKNIPLFIVNGRISPNSYKGYKRFGFFFKRILSNYTSILMQAEGDAKRIIDIGANPNIVKVMGNLKYDLDFLTDKNIQNEMKTSIAADDYKIIIAGSTHQREDEIALNVFKKLRQEFSDIKLIIAPRHPERNEHVMKLISASGERFSLRSAQGDLRRCEVLLLDTMGELSKMYAACTIAFIGGSFSGTGGHNPLEPAIYNVPTVSGPSVFNFKDIYRYMTEHGAASVVNSEHELYITLRELLSNPDRYKESSAACSKIFDTNKGAIDFVINNLINYKICS